MATCGSNGDIPLRQRFSTPEGLRLEPSQSVGTQTVAHTAGETAQLLVVTEKLRGLHWMYARSAEHFTCLHWSLSMPTIASTAVSGMLGFLSSSAPPEHKASLGVAVGVLGAVGGIAQGMLSAFGFEARAARDRQAADSYEQLLTRCSFELAHPDEPDFYKDIESSLLEINKKTQPPPQWIVDRYARDRPTVALPV
jgi:hypothetical protein